MEYLIEYALFAAKLLTAAALLAVPLLLVLGARQSRHSRPQATIEVRLVNDDLLDAQLNVEAALLPEKAFKKRLKEVRKETKARASAAPDENASRTFLCDFEGDMHASAVAELREEISAILSVATPADRVIVVLESGGGTIHDYGLAASQLRRIRDREIHLTVVVDRIAASGGYMMACVANRISAAPFAIIGSIGVVAQVPNFHRLLKKHDIDFEQITAGKYKRTLSLFGENTDEGRSKFQQDMDEAHQLFKAFIAESRPQLDLENTATGEYWFASRALELGLVDHLATSDDVIAEAASAGGVYRVYANRKRSFGERLAQPLTRALAAYRP
jgi:serine protease SohB